MPTVAVLGGGYAGVKAARDLSKLLDRSWTIVLVERGSGHQLLTRVPEVVGGAIPAGRACIPYGEIFGRRVQVVRAEVQAVDTSTRVVTTSRGRFTSDWLVLALGSTTDFLGVPGAREHGLVVRSVASARHLCQAVAQGCRSQRQVRLAIVGAGYTGTEVAGVLAEWNRRLVRLGSSARIAVTLAAQDGRLLPEGNKRLAPVAEAVLASKGVVLMLGTPAQQVEVDRVYLRDGGAIEADVVVWAARTRGCQVPTSGPLRLNPEGRIVVDPYLRALGHERVYVAGDLAAAIDYARDRPVPATAQLAIQEAAVVAHNLAAEVRGSTLREFLARPIGEALSLGGSDAVAEVAGVVVSGRLAASVKSTALLRYLVGLGGPRLAARYS